MELVSPLSKILFIMNLEFLKLSFKKSTSQKYDLKLSGRVLFTPKLYHIYGATSFHFVLTVESAEGKRKELATSYSKTSAGEEVIPKSLSRIKDP